jgi:hypothetical protein
MGLDAVSTIHTLCINWLEGRRHDRWDVTAEGLRADPVRPAGTLSPRTIAAASMIGNLTVVGALWTMRLPTFGPGADVADVAVPAR